jgi:hypothetical protein
MVQKKGGQISIKRDAAASPFISPRQIKEAGAVGMGGTSPELFHGMKRLALLHEIVTPNRYVHRLADVLAVPAQDPRLPMRVSDIRMRMMDAVEAADH